MGMQPSQQSGTQNQYFSTAPNTSGYGQFGIQTPSLNYGKLADSVTQGKTLSGQNINTFQMPGNFQFQKPNHQAFQYNTPQIQNVPQQAYTNAMNRGIEGIQQDQARFGAQAQAGMSARGLGQGGMANAQQNALARNAANQAAGLRSQYGLQQAQSQVDVAKHMAPIDLQRQQLQAGENQYLSGLDQWLQQSQAAQNMQHGQLGLQGQQALNQMNLQNIGALGSLQSGATQEAMMPYTMASQLYGANLGAPVSGGGGKGDPLSAMLNVGGSMGAAAICLPRGAEIELENGGTARVEEIKTGDTVKGGRVIATHSRKRAPGHVFYRHQFDTGEVTMSDGHPYFDNLVSKDIVEHESPNTYDILTDGGHYFVNGVKLGSTIQGGDYAAV